MKKAFTLIELILVGAVIAILIVIAVPRFLGMQQEGNIAKAKAELSVLQAAVEQYYINNYNVYPQYLSYLTNDSPQVVGFIPEDPFAAADKWGNIPTYSYVRDGTDDQYYVIYSVGPDGNGSAWIDSSTDTVVEWNGDSCIFVSNAGRDTIP